MALAGFVRHSTTSQAQLLAASAIKGAKPKGATTRNLILFTEISLVDVFKAAELPTAHLDKHSAGAIFLNEGDSSYDVVPHVQRPSGVCFTVTPVRAAGVISAISFPFCEFVKNL